VETITKQFGDVKDLALADAGKRRIEWANQHMPVLQLIRKRFIKEQPLKGVRISACLHITSETANLAITLRDGHYVTRWRGRRGALRVESALHPG
jgi:adenosylhomocysteinase